ncbi:hypothetical protein GX408_03840 [bacterium]|nr:hypothetical protein [bacterium]
MNTKQCAVLLSVLLPLGANAKQSSVFYSQDVRSLLQARAATDPWGQQIRDQAVRSAAPWLAMSDEALWNLIFAPTITRSWMVWSNGFCPACKKSVTMYNWKIDALAEPWKVQCPHCHEFFPKNDFAAYYRSGLDSQSLFDPKKADQTLLFNTDHPNLHDPLHRFGVDDGEGYAEDGRRWRFIGAYLIYGQWKQLIVAGVRNLAAAYVLTGDRAYSHKAAVLLDRISDVYPSFDFNTQALVYERSDPITSQGYVTVWHDACEETRELALSYDMIYDGLEDDAELASFISRKAKQCKLGQVKTNVSAIRRHIEENLLRDALRNRRKIESNFPRTDAAMAVMETILGWPEDRPAVLAVIDRFIARATAMDGLSGEKGLAGYSAGCSRCLAQFLSLYSRLEPAFIADLMARHSNLHKTFRFHIDTWFAEQYYPNIGDCGVFAQKAEYYIGASFSRNPIPTEISAYSFTSGYSLFQQLFEITGDPAYIQILYRENQRSLQGLPYDLLSTDEGFQQKTAAAIEKYGVSPQVHSFNKKDWCLAMFYSGSGQNQRAVWIDYDIGGNHCHADAMNIGLFAGGLDLLPPFGYPPVQFGGWTSDKALWYRKTASHNTVVVDGHDQMPGIGLPEAEPLAVQLDPLKKHERGLTTCELPGRQVQAIRVSGPGLYHGVQLQQYERTIGLIDLSAEASYVLDIFRVVGGSDHAKFTHGYFGELQPFGFTPTPAADYGHGTQMGSFCSDPSPEFGWQARWSIEDRYGYLSKDSHLHLNYFDLTREAEVATAKSWIAFGFTNEQTAEIPALMIRRKAERAPLSSCFVGIFEPYTSQSLIRSIERLEVVDAEDTPYGDMSAAVLVQSVDGVRDLILAMDVENPADQIPCFRTTRRAQVPACRLTTDAEFCLVRTDAHGALKKVALAHGTFLRTGDFEIQTDTGAEFIEVDLEGKTAALAAGRSEAIKSCKMKSQRLRIAVPAGK